MEWPVAVIPAVLIALSVRMDALLVGPYWALIELIPEWGEAPAARRRALVRRFIYPLLIVAITTGIADATIADGMIIGALGAGLLLWPIVFHGMPWQAVPYPSLAWGIYLGFGLGFAGAGALGAFLAGFVRQLAIEGRLWTYLQENLVWALIAILSSVVGGTVQDKRASKIEHQRLSDDQTSSLD